MLTISHRHQHLHLGRGFENQEPPWYERESYFNQRLFDVRLLNHGFYPLWQAWCAQYQHVFPEIMTIFKGSAKHVDGHWRLSAQGKFDQLVQSFVDEHDGQALLILLECSNPHDLGRVHSNHSLVAYRRDPLIHREQDAPEATPTHRIHVPHYGDFIGTHDEQQLLAIASALGDKANAA